MSIVNNDFGDPSIKHMLRSIAKTSPISREDEHALFAEYSNARTTRSRKYQIRQKIIESNMRFVLQSCLQYKNYRGVDFQDLVSEGKLGLFVAFEKFNYLTNNKFISYAVWYIKSHISKYLEENDLIRLPSHQKVKLNYARKHLDIDEFDDELLYLHQISQSHTSFDSPISSDDESVFGDIIPDTNNDTPELQRLHDRLKSEINLLLPTILDSEECIVISSLYGIGSDCNLTNGLRETSDIIGKSHERVRQVRDNAIRKLRKSTGVSGLNDLLRDFVCESRE